MNNTRNLYTKAKEYQDKRKAIVDAYEGRLASLERMKGSQYYEEEAKKAEAERDTAVSALKEEYSPAFEAIMGEMLAAAGRREAQAPTAEELRIVQALKLRDYKSMRNVNEEILTEELSHIARAVKGNAMCLSIVQDVARENGIHTDFTSMYTGSNMPIETVKRCMSAISGILTDFMDHDTKYASRIAREAHEKRFGKMDEGNKPEEVRFGLGRAAGYTPLPKRELFNTQEEFYSSLFNMKDATYANFSAAVND